MLALIGAAIASGCATSSSSRSTTSEPPLTEAVVELPSGTVFYMDSGGKGIPVVFVHPNNPRMWQNQLAAFARARYRVIAIDSRNRSAGAADPVPAAGNIARIDELTERLALPRFHIVGTGGGSVVAIQFGIAYPNKVRSVVITNSLGGLRDPQLNALELSLRPQGFNQLPQEFRELSGSYRAADPEGVKHWLSMEEDGRSAVSPRPAVAASSQSAPPPAPPNPYEVTLTKLDSWQIPTLIITGDADLYTPPSVMRMFAAHLRRGQGAVIAESGHNAYWENPTAFNREVLTFVAKY
ncbi:MAG: alpha/beta hydrolase [Steroidobacteraceae bacterium]